MIATTDRRVRGALHPLHGVLLAGTITLFLGALLSDIAYASTYQIQWSNFASWLIVGGLVFAGLALVYAIVDLFRANRDRWSLLYFLAVLATFVLGFINALIHARDAWASMPTGLVLSALVTILAVGAAWIGLAGRDARGGK